MEQGPGGILVYKDKKWLEPIQSITTKKRSIEDCETIDDFLVYGLGKSEEELEKLDNDIRELNRDLFGPTPHYCRNVRT